MNVTFSPNAEKQASKLPKPVLKKLKKQADFLRENPRHPSLRSRKMTGENKYEARIDYHNRFTYLVEGDEIIILTVGPHDEGLGKK
ncbi:hypothetical protein A2721_03145 [Candidatus Gottesmanbacteria bacterium RIFCSPHIGHO2_01_FULL_47_48]|uniref:Addiction module toxin RelE n=1 Tax=Candidatus Gottesmanbacteria bacterium RIFCSPHIGHO2_01_FULL_47_48 TaxID=1798381 RepID=A0A1F5ZZ82_9BACT|nr:MAG: hypothetical protein A2721_03145 [Candidatus Gottesmanbacteria bacterium RIFCSPHIGHO2_01_FULL_47_48]